VRLVLDEQKTLAAVARDLDLTPAPGWGSADPTTAMAHVRHVRHDHLASIAADRVAAVLLPTRC
jgi:hypothetical protein